jgi:hypothetical protein
MLRLAEIGYKLLEIDMATDAQRLEWLEAKFFNAKFDKDEEVNVWYLAGDYRNILKNLRGNSLREAIDNELNAGNSKTV